MDNMANTELTRTDVLLTPTGNPTYYPAHGADGSAVIENVHLQPSLNDLHNVAADIKNTLTAAITALSLDVRAVTAR